MRSDNERSRNGGGDGGIGGSGLSSFLYCAGPIRGASLVSTTAKDEEVRALRSTSGCRSTRDRIKQMDDKSACFGNELSIEKPRYEMEYYPIEPPEYEISHFAQGTRSRKRVMSPRIFR